MNKPKKPRESKPKKQREKLHKKTIWISVELEVLKDAQDIASKTTLKISHLIGLAAAAGWPIIMQRWKKILKGVN